MSLEGYNGWLSEISKRYRQSQIKAAVAVNTEMLKFYFGLGRDIVRMEKAQPWGSGFLKRLSVDLKMQMPDARCFSVTNLKYIRLFFKLYAEKPIGHQVGGQIPDNGAKQLSHQVGGQSLHQVGAKKEIQPVCQKFGDKSYVMNFEEVCPTVTQLIFSVPWRHHIVLIDKFRTNQKVAMFYVREIVKNGWSRSVLLHFLDTKLHERQGKAVTNFAVALPAADSDLAQEMTKDPYCFDFIALTPKYREKELKDAMMAHIEKFLLELGQGFMLVGREYHLQVGAKEVIADLLFFNMNLNRYVVVEVKAGEFEADHLGQLGLYVSAVNHILKSRRTSRPLGFSSARRRITRWLNERLSHRNNPLAFQNTASARFCQRRLQATFRASPTSNLQLAV